MKGNFTNTARFKVGSIQTFQSLPLGSPAFRIASQGLASSLLLSAEFNNKPPLLELKSRMNWEITGLKISSSSNSQSFPQTKLAERDPLPQEFLLWQSLERTTELCHMLSQVSSKWRGCRFLPWIKVKPWKPIFISIGTICGFVFKCIGDKSATLNDCKWMLLFYILRTLKNPKPNTSECHVHSWGDTNKIQFQILSPSRCQRCESRSHKSSLHPCVV